MAHAALAGPCWVVTRFLDLSYRLYSCGASARRRRPDVDVPRRFMGDHMPKDQRLCGFPRRPSSALVRSDGDARCTVTGLVRSAHTLEVLEEVARLPEPIADPTSPRPTARTDSRGCGLALASLLDRTANRAPDARLEAAASNGGEVPPRGRRGHPPHRGSWGAALMASRSVLRAGACRATSE